MFVWRVSTLTSGVSCDTTKTATGTLTSCWICKAGFRTWSIRRMELRPSHKPPGPSGSASYRLTAEQIHTPEAFFHVAEENQFSQYGYVH
jgi:hypothetical protein